MSKERLERIEHNAERTALLTKPPQPLVTISDSDFEWLIEQAELGVSQQEQFHDYQAQNLRLQERLDKLQELRNNYLILTKENNQVNDELIDEFRKSKRYREVIKKAIDDLENECLWDALVRLKALEGEK